MAAHAIPAAVSTYTVKCRHCGWTTQGIDGQGCDSCRQSVMQTKPVAAPASTTPATSALAAAAAPIQPIAKKDENEENKELLAHFVRIGHNTTLSGSDGAFVICRPNEGDQIFNPAINHKHNIVLPNGQLPTARVVKLLKVFDNLIPTKTPFPEVSNIRDFLTKLTFIVSDWKDIVHHAVGGLYNNEPLTEAKTGELRKELMSLLLEITKTQRIYHQKCAEEDAKHEEEVKLLKDELQLPW
jgi:hypothetical protein